MKCLHFTNEEKEKFMDDLKEKNDVKFKHVEGMGEFVSKQAEEIIIIQNQIADAVAKAELAINASNRAADMNVGLFFHRKNIIALQEQARRQGEATSSQMEAIMLLFHYQRQLAVIMGRLFEIGAMNIANNRAMIKELESLVKEGADHKLCEEAISQLKDVKTKLENQKDYLEKVDNLESNVKSLALDSVIVHKNLLELKEGEIDHEIRLAEYERFVKKIEGEKVYIVHQCPKCGKNFRLGALICPSCGEIFYGMDQNIPTMKQLGNLLSYISGREKLYEKNPNVEFDNFRILNIKKIIEITQVFKPYITDEIDASYYDEILYLAEKYIENEESSDVGSKIYDEIYEIITELISINHKDYGNIVGQISDAQNVIRGKESEIRKIKSNTSLMKGIISKI